MKPISGTKSAKIKQKSLAKGPLSIGISKKKIMKFKVEEAKSESDSEVSDEESSFSSDSEMENTDNSISDSVDSDTLPQVPDSTILKAVDAVKKIESIYQEKKSDLFAEDTPILIQIEAIKISKCTKRKLRLKLPHNLVTESSDICLFVCDLKKGKKVDHEPTVHHYEDLLKEKGINNIKTIIPVRQLKVEYDQIEMKRRLLTQYDFFLADGRVSGLLSHKLGAIFFKKNQLPTPIKMDSKDLKEEINKALHKTVLRLHGEGNTFAIRVSNGKLKQNQICENIQAILTQLAKQFPGGWNNIRSVSVKTPLSLSIPVYLTLRNKNSVRRPVLKQLKSLHKPVEGDITTISNGTVKVFPTGKVIVIRKRNNKGGSDDDEPVNEAPVKKIKLNGNSLNGDSNKSVANKQKPTSEEDGNESDEQADEANEESENEAQQSDEGSEEESSGSASEDDDSLDLNTESEDDDSSQSDNESE